jgi:hypothetical protein
MPRSRICQDRRDFAALVARNNVSHVDHLENGLSVLSETRSQGWNLDIRAPTGRSINHGGTPAWVGSAYSFHAHAREGRTRQTDRRVKTQLPGPLLWGTEARLLSCQPHAASRATGQSRPSGTYAHPSSITRMPTRFLSKLLNLETAFCKHAGPRSCPALGFSCPIFLTF